MGNPALSAVGQKWPSGYAPPLPRPGTLLQEGWVLGPERQVSSHLIPHLHPLPSICHLHRHYPSPPCFGFTKESDLLPFFLHSDAEELPPPTPPGMSVFFSSPDNFPIIIIISNLLANAKKQTLFWAPHIYNSLNPHNNALRQVLFQIGQLRQRKLVMYQG